MNKTGRVAFGVLLATLLATVVVCDIDSASASQFGLNYSAFIEQSNTIVLPNNDPSLSITPSSAGATGTTNFNVTVYSNSSSGYTLTLSAADTSLSGESSGGSIDTVTETATSLSGIQANHWGVNIPGTDLNHESGYYYAMASSSAPFTLINSNAATGQSGRSVTINAGAKLDLATPADTYSTTLNFAVVSAPAPISILDMHDMQDFASLTPAEINSVVDSMGTEINYAIGDSRDTGANDTARYTIAKLRDGKVWMTTNLDLAGETALYSDDSNVAAANTKASGTPYYTLPASSTSGFNDDAVAYVYNSGNQTSTCSEPGCYSYYSWLAATAGGKDTSGNAVADYYNAPYSICPAGWRLPTATTSNASATSNNNWKTGDSYALATAYGANLEGNFYDESSATGGNFNANAGPTSTLPKFLLGGYYLYSSFITGGHGGGYWSATSSSSSDAYNLYFASSSFWSANNGYRRLGYSVRCILDNSIDNISDIEYMQDFANLDSTEQAAVLDSMTVGQSYSVQDSRDNKEYHITKLHNSDTNKDYLWMLDNLALSATTNGNTPRVLTSSDSDINPNGVTYTDPSTSQQVTKTTFTMPTETWSSSNQDYYCKAIMAVATSGNEDYYYYNWYAAKANPYECSGPTSPTNSTATNDAYSLGSICPAGWTLPDYSNDITTAMLNTTGNPGALVTSGNFRSGSQIFVGTYGVWWSSARTKSNGNAYILLFDDPNVIRDNSSEYDGLSVRCMRSGS